MSVESSTPRRYVVALLLFALSLFGRLALAPILGEAFPFITFFPAIAASAWYGGLGPGLITVVLSAISSVYLFFKLGAITKPDVVGLALFLVIGALISWLNEARRRSERRAQDELLARRQSETELREREDELKRSEQRFRALIENSSDAIALIDEHATILYASASTTRVLGYTPEEFVGRNGLDLVHPDDRNRVQDTLASRSASSRVERPQSKRVPAMLMGPGVGSKALSPTRSRMPTSTRSWSITAIRANGRDLRNNCYSHRKWKRSVALPVASHMISTTC